VGLFNTLTQYETASKIRVSTFSDNVVASNTRAVQEHFLYTLAVIQFMIAGMGFLLRGGVTIGQIVHEKDVVFGPALNRAYEIESTVAVMPRIVIDTDRRHMFRSLPSFVVEEEGLLFLDPFTTEFVSRLFEDMIKLKAVRPDAFPDVTERVIRTEGNPKKELYQLMLILEPQLRQPIGDKEWRKIAWIFDRVASRLGEPVRARSLRQTVLHYPQPH
jgi:hypothetical protein